MGRFKAGRRPTPAHPAACGATLWSVVLLAWSCDAPVVPGEGGETLTVTAPVSGVVRVGARQAPVSPLSPAVLDGLAEPPYALTFQSENQALTVLGVEGPDVSLDFLLGGARPLGSPLVAVELRGAPSGLAAAVAITRDAVSAGTERAGRWRFLVRADAPVELVGLWVDRSGRPEAIGRRVVADPKLAEGRTLVITPDLPLEQELVIALGSEPAGWVEAELTVSGLRTGVRLGGGLAGPREAVVIPRPEGETTGLGVWVTANARRVDEAEPWLDVGRHLGLDVAAVSIRWPEEAPVSPTPASTPARAPWLGRQGPTARFSEPPPDATALWVALSGDDGCRVADWEVLAPTADSALSLPVSISPDPLGFPLLRGRLGLLRYAGLGLGDLIGPDRLTQTELPRLVSGYERRAQIGWLSSGPVDCVAEPRAGEYMLREDGVCRSGEPAPRVVISRCGAVVPVAPSERAARLGCASLEGDLLHAREGGAWPVEPVEGGGLRVLHPDGALILVPLDDPTGVTVGPSLLGDWYRAKVTEQLRADQDGVPGPALGAATHLAAGGPANGPYLTIERAGRLRFSVGDVRWTGRVVTFDGVDGEVEVTGLDCSTEVRPFALRLDAVAGAVSIIRVTPAQGGDLRVRTHTIRRR